MQPMSSLLPAQNYSFLAGLASADPAIATHAIAMVVASGLPLAPDTFAVLDRNGTSVADESARNVLREISLLGNFGPQGGEIYFTEQKAAGILDGLSKLSAAGTRELSRAAIDSLDEGAFAFCGSFDKVWAAAVAKLGGPITYQLPQFTKSDAVIPEVLQIKRDGLLSQEFTDRFGVNQIAESVVARIRKQRLRSTGKLRADFRKSCIKIYLKRSAIEGMVRAGIQNVHQTGTGWFVDRENYLEHRTNFENAVAGVRIEDPRIRPKYGMLEVYEPSLFAHFGANTYLRGNNCQEEVFFGDVAAVLKNSVKTRTTFSLADSLNKLYDREAPPSSGSRILRSGIRVFDDGPSSFSAADLDYHYMEAQVWGDVGLEDIEYFILGDYYLLENGDEAVARMTGQLETVGLPVFKKMYGETPMSDFFPEHAIAELVASGEAQTINDQGMWIAGKTLYAGDWRKMLELERRRLQFMTR